MLVISNRIKRIKSGRIDFYRLCKSMFVQCDTIRSKCLIILFFDHKTKAFFGRRQHIKSGSVASATGVPA